MFISCKVLLRRVYRKISICFALFFILYFFVTTRYNKETSTKPTANIFCHYSEADDALSPIDDSYYPSPNSIFFHETSCSRYLTSRQLCAIESAARAHPDYEIYVLFSSPKSNDDLDDNTFKLLYLINNIIIARVHIIKYAKDTPLETLIKDGALLKSKWIVHHISDLLRFITLYKWSGVYLDLNYVVAKPLDSLAKNFVTKGSNMYTTGSVLALSSDKMGREMAELMIREIQRTFNDRDWRHSDGVVEQVLKRVCNTNDVALMSGASCEGLEVYGPEFFYPVHWKQVKEYFKQGELQNKDAYLYHAFNNETSRYKVHRDSPYAKLAKQYCPLTYEFYGDKF